MLSASPLRCISMNNQECKERPQIINVKSDEPVFYPFSIKTSKCSGSKSRTNETRHIKWHETCRIIINAGVNAKKWLIKVYAIKNLFGIQVIANENAMNYVMLENI